MTNRASWLRGSRASRSSSCAHRTIRRATSSTPARIDAPLCCARGQGTGRSSMRPISSSPHAPRASSVLERLSESRDPAHAVESVCAGRRAVWRAAGSPGHRQPAAASDSALRHAVADGRSSAEAHRPPEPRGSGRAHPRRCCAEREKLAERPQALATDSSRVAERCQFPAGSNAPMRTRFWRRSKSVKLIVRDQRAHPMLPECLRISVGTPEQNQRLLAAVNTAGAGNDNCCRDETGAVHRSRWHAHRGAGR